MGHVIREKECQKMEIEQTLVVGVGVIAVI